MTITCETGGRREYSEALGLLSEMSSQGIKQNTVTYNAAISACGNGGQPPGWEEALRLLSEMVSQGIERCTMTYSPGILPVAC